MDTVTKRQRSMLMAKVRGRGNRSTELELVRLMRNAGITGWRRHAAVFGNPDFVFRGPRLAVFVDGCFWHGCPRHETKPRNNAAYWRKKFARNKARDGLVTRTLHKSGWRVLRIWEHELARKRKGRLVARIRARTKSASSRAVQQAATTHPTA